jgi:hypothetical protein
VGAGERATERTYNGAVRLLLLALVPGCDVVFGIGAVRDAGPDAPDAPDAAAIDAGICRVIDRQVSADVILYSTNPTQGHQFEEIMNVGVAQSAESLQRFPMPALESGEQYTAVRLVETYVAKSNACGASCGSCDNLDLAGPFHVAYATSTWNETYACYSFRDNGTAWAVPGAMAANERSLPLATSDYAARADLAFDLPITELADWAESGQISVILGGTGGGQIVVPQKDYGPACAPPPEPVHMQFTVCR